jgi:23S rRNA (guanosine2251-2'-O)-methyltransferase
MNHFQNRRKDGPKNDETMVFGLRPIIELIKSGKKIDKLLIQQGLTGETYGELRILLKKMSIPSQFVPVDKLNRITNKNHQGVIGYLAAITYQTVEEVIPFIFESGKTPLILVLDRITDVRNFGAITRTAECAGVDCIIIPEKGSAQVNSDAIKTSAGALLKVPVCRVPNLKFTIDYLKKCGIQVIACSEKAEKLFDETDYRKPTAVILGSEEDGISPEILRLADGFVKIPLFGEIASLNVSVATGILLYEIIKQRKKI